MNKEIKKYIVVSVAQESIRYHDILGIPIVASHFSLQHFIKAMENILPVEDHAELYTIICELIQGYFTQERYE